MIFQRRATQIVHGNEEDAYTKLRRIAELAKRDKKVKFTSLAHLLTPEFLGENFRRLNQKASPGSDGVTIEEYKKGFDANIEQLWTELKSGKYRAVPVRRRYIQKPDGRQRPLGIPTVSDRIVQRAVSEIVSAIYEPYFCDFSYGFRPGRSAHQALECLRAGIEGNNIGYVVEADIEGYFDNVNHEWLRKFLCHRIADSRLLQIIGKWLKAGFMDNGVVVRDEKGTPQGGPISPLLSNIYLHYVLDLWFEMKFKRTCEGKTFLVRYADDFVTCFEVKEEAERFLREMEERFAEFGLRLSGAKTRIIEFGKKSSLNGTKGPGEPRSFDFLGFTFFMRKSKIKDWYHVATKPSRKSRNRFLQRVKEWCVKTRHSKAMCQAMHLRRMLNGFYNYFDQNIFCYLSLVHLKANVLRIFVKSLMRRSQRTKLAWKRVQKCNWYAVLPDPKRFNLVEAIPGSRMP